MWTSATDIFINFLKGEEAMTDLTDTQRAIIEEGVKKKHNDIHELDSFYKHMPAVREKVIQGMLKRGLLTAARTEGKKTIYVLSESAQKAIATPASAEKPAKASAKPKGKPKAKSGASPKPSGKKPGKSGAKPRQASGKSETKPGKTTKQQVIIDLLSRKEGATLSQLVKATDWQQHSIHGAMANMRKKLKLAINSTKEDGKDRVYRIAA